MVRYLVLLGIAFTAGCASFGTDSYKPKKSREKKAFERADRSVTMMAVKTNFQAHVTHEVAWAGIIEDIQFKEMERTIQVAFSVEHRDFDWKDHGGGKPYHLSAEGQGHFTAGWTVDKPARISYLRTLAKPGYMLIIYGKPYRMQDGVVQLAATAVRPIAFGDFDILPMSGNLPTIGSVAEAEE